MVAATDLGSSQQTGSLHTQEKKQKLFSVTYSRSPHANSTDRALGLCWSTSCCRSLQRVALLLGKSLGGDAGSSCRQRSPWTHSYVWLLGLGCKFCHEIQITFNECVFSIYIASVTAKPCWVVGSYWSPAITVINVINCSYKKQFHSDC